MAEITKTTREIGLREPNFNGGSAMLKMVLSDQEGFTNKSEKSANVVLDMESLAQFADNKKEVISSPRISLQRNLSRKGSHQHRGDQKKISERVTDETSKQASSKGLSLNSTPEKSVIVPMMTELPNSGETNGRSKRYNKLTPWVDPRRILIIFATLSSMGTIILIYFTLAIGKINGDDTQAQ